MPMFCCAPILRRLLRHQRLQSFRLDPVAVIIAEEVVFESQIVPVLFEDMYLDALVLFTVGGKDALEFCI